MFIKFFIYIAEGKKKNMNNPKLYSPAFPPVPTQDNYGRIVALMPGMTLLDYATIKIYSQNCDKLTFEEAVNLAKDLIDLLYNQQSTDNLETNLSAI